MSSTKFSGDEMKEERKSNEVIVLDYYDGVTEGFSRSLGQLGAAYFRMIAWDDNRDERLFAVVSVAEETFEKIFYLVGQVEWPNWESLSELQEAELDRFVEVCQSQLLSNGLLVKGAHVDSKGVTICAIADSMALSVSRALQDPESLDDWLVLL